MDFVSDKKISIGRELNDVDKFTINFINILEKYTNYVIVSGYVAILLGRNRGTDDIDIIIPRMDKAAFTLFYDELVKRGYWCINSSNIEDIWDLLTSKHSARFAVEPAISPNAEIKFAKDVYDAIALRNPLSIRLNGSELMTSFLELQIAYKEEVLKSNKDLEDARHIRFVAKGHLNEELISEYKKELRGK